MRIKIPEAFEGLFTPNRYKVFWGGRGGAKSWNFARALLVLGTQRKMRVLCTREMQKSIKDSVHKLLGDQIEALGLGAQYEILTTEIRGKNGTEFLFAGLSTQTAESIKSFEGVDIVWVEEAQAVSDSSWRILIPTIRKEGSEIWVSFNPDTKHDPVYQRFILNPPEGALVRKVSWRDNPWLSDELKAEMEHLKATDEEDYRHVWEGELKAIADNAVYAKQLLLARAEGRICQVPIASGVPVDTFWDLGRNDHTAIWFMQSVGPQYRFIDYFEDRMEQLEHYIKLLKSKPYIYGRHYLPHDVEVEILGMLKTRKKQLEEAGIKPIEVVPRVPHEIEGIEMVRQIFSQCWFDERRCETGLEALSNVVWKFDESNDTHSRNTVHNWASNGGDAFRQFAQGYKPQGKRKPLPKQDYSWVV